MASRFTREAQLAKFFISRARENRGSQKEVLLKEQRPPISMKLWVENIYSALGTLINHHFNKHVLIFRLFQSPGGVLEMNFTLPQ